MMIYEKFSVPNDSDLKISKKRRAVVIPNAHARLWMSIVLVNMDIIGLLSSLFVSSQIRHLQFSLITSDAYIGLAMMMCMFIGIMFYRNDLYPAIGLHFVEELRRVVLNISYTFLIIIAFTFLLKNTAVYSRITLVLTWILSPFFILFMRQLMRRLLIHFGLWGEPVALIGDVEKTLPLERYFRRNPRFSIRPVAVLRDEHCASCGMHNYHTMSTDEIKTYVQQQSIQTGIIVPNDYNNIDDWIDRYRYIFQNLIMIRYQRGRFGLNSLVPLDFADVLGLQVRHNLASFWPQVFKRIFDVVFASLGLIFLFPFLAAVAIIIRFDSAGPVLYRNECVGRAGRKVGVLKFRTMYKNASEILEKMLAEDDEIRLEWEQYHKLKKDPRITRVGGFLRHFSIDELPQLWNVLVGELSLVGPRPMKDWEAERYGPTFHDYGKVSPGITGLWQISGRNHTTFARRAELDYEYIQRWSFWLDLYILVKTIEVVLGRKGAY